jgi:hypothetical protein
MKRLLMLASLVFAHTTFAAPTAADSSSEGKAAEVASEGNTAVALVSNELLQPLAEKERNRGRFSRARLPAQERRVRILDEQARKDTRGNAFVAFAVDARHGVRAAAAADDASWRKATITGCVYLDSGEIFVKKGDQYRPAAFLLGKKLQAAAAGTCEPGPAQVAQSN